MASLPTGIDLSTVPLAAPPPGATSNFINPESFPTTTMGIGIFMLVLTAIVVIIRLFSNYRATRGLGWDDCSCVTATVLFLIYVSMSLELRKGTRHEYDIPITWLSPKVTKELYVQSITTAPMSFFAKSSLSMLYYRLFRNKKFIRYAIIFGIAFSVIFYFGNMIVVGIICAPRMQHPWDWTIVLKCSRTTVFGFVLAIGNLALDVFLLILPMPVIFQLQLSTKKKTGIVAIFMVGLFALVASIVSLVYRIRLWQSIDPSWNEGIVMICAIIEMGVTIMCSSTPALVMFWKSHIANYVVPLYSRLGDRYSKLATRFKLVYRASSNTRTCPAESDQSKSHPSFDNLNYVELNEHLEPATFLRGSVTTDIGGGSPTSEVERGVIRKVMKVEQSFN